jgi:hypothetical protein
MKERPIIFNSEMVRAILKGEKTQTRRVIKPQPPGDYQWQGWVIETTGSKTDIGKAGWRKGYLPSIYVRCPYGEPGDELWVRETWAGHVLDGMLKPSEFTRGYNCVYRADIPQGDSAESHHVWRPSIFMPRWASRIQLRIINIWCERLQDIADPQAEGVGYWGCDTIEVFEDLWDSINAKRGFSFASNPWVWAVEFEVV